MAKKRTTKKKAKAAPKRKAAKKKTRRAAKPDVIQTVHGMFERIIERSESRSN